MPAALPRRFPPWVLLVALIPGLLNLIPSLFGFLEQAPPERVYLGFRYQLSDHAQYMAMVNSAARDLSPLFDNPYVTEHQDGRFMMLYLWGVGLTSRLTGLGAVTTWYLLGLLVAWAFFLTTWRVASALLEEVRTRRVAFLLVCFGGGVDWMLRPDSTTYPYFNWSSFGAAHMPMWLAGYTLVLLAVLIALDSLRSEAGRLRALRVLLVAPLLLLAFWVHPYTALLGLSVLGLAGGLPWLARLLGRAFPQGFDARDSLRLIAVTAVAALLIGGFALWARQDAVYAATSNSFFLWRERYSPLWYPLTYGLPLLLAAVGLYHAVRATRPTTERWLMVGWLLSTLALSASPMFAGLKFQFTVHLPLAVMAAFGVERIMERGGRLASLGRRRSFMILFWAVCTASSARLPFRDLPQIAEDQIYASQPQLDLLEHLRALPPGNVAAPPLIAMLLPWKAGKPVYYGHWYMSYGRDERIAALQRLYHPSTPLAWRRQFVDAQELRYLIEGPWTRGRLEVHATALGFEEAYANAYGRILARRSAPQR